MIRFTGQPHSEPISINIPYRAVCDEELTLALADAITVLVRAIGFARGQDISGDAAGVRWVKEFLLGFSILAVGEARSVIMLLSDGLCRNARVHMRALFEYELRTKLLIEDPQRALAFRDSVAFELRKLGRGMSVPSEVVESQIAQVLGIDDPSTVVGCKESGVFGGTARAQMQNEIWPEKRYFGSFAGMSWISHGSILAIREVSAAVEGAGPDLLARATDDGNGNDHLHHAAWIMLKFAGWIQEHFHAQMPEAEAVAARIIAANERLGIISKEQESAAAEALAARNRHASS